MQKFGHFLAGKLKFWLFGLHNYLVVNRPVFETFALISKKSIAVVIPNMEKTIAALKILTIICMYVAIFLLIKKM